MWMEQPCDERPMRCSRITTKRHCYIHAADGFTPFLTPSTKNSKELILKPTRVLQTSVTRWPNTWIFLRFHKAIHWFTTKRCTLTSQINAHINPFFAVAAKFPSQNSSHSTHFILILCFMSKKCRLQYLLIFV